ncbi:hypothetical protein BDV59DRAFT_96426 [Aspergillus ambiguus]|uniref:uncharacterized protein n=1 Tax=Aspergillus ambiguus TaxID=176160 RepID=UPI003CCDE155
MKRLPPVGGKEGKNRKSNAQRPSQNRGDCPVGAPDPARLTSMSESRRSALSRLGWIDTNSFFFPLPTTPDRSRSTSCPADLEIGFRDYRFVCRLRGESIAVSSGAGQGRKCTKTAGETFYRDAVGQVTERLSVKPSRRHVYGSWVFLGRRSQ